MLVDLLLTLQTALLCRLGLSPCGTTNPSYDYIVIGGGTAGLVVADGLSKDPSVSVAVIEAGQFVEDDATLIPALYASFIGNPDLDWQFLSIPQPHASNSSIYLPRGKAVGGTSTVNGMYFVRAAQKDYDAWELLGNPGWNWESVNAYIKAIENFSPASDQDAARFGATDSLSNHGRHGPIEVSYSTFWEPEGVIEAFISSLNSLGVPPNDHAAAGDTFGTWQAPCTIKADNRSRAYPGNSLSFGKAQSNLALLTGAEAVKIVFKPKFTSSDDSWATSAKYIADGSVHTLDLAPNGAVILAAGTYQTPKLLELSGIGNSTFLEQYGISPQVDLPGVGENLQDHFGILTTYELGSGLARTIEDLFMDSAFFAEQKELYLNNRTGVLGSVPATTIAMFPFQSFINETRWRDLLEVLDVYLEGYKDTPFAKQFALQRSILDDPSVPQIELVMLPGLMDPKVVPDTTKSHLTIAAVIMHPFARGSVHLKSSIPAEHPRIDPNFLGFTEFETDITVEALRFVERLVQTEPLSAFIAKTLSPPIGLTNTELKQFVQSNIISTWHPCGSTSMLPLNQGGVVDSNLKVYGTSNVYVADASIIPLEIGTHTMATVYANALKAVELIAISRSKLVSVKDENAHSEL